MAKTKTVRVSSEELDALHAWRNSQKATAEAVEEAPTKAKPSESQQALADAFVSAIERTRPPEKKNVFNRKVNTPWSPKQGEPRLKLKRKMYQHGMLISDKITNEEIELLNKVRPGHYCDGVVRVTLRKDRGIDIDYAMQTAAQRLKLVNTYGITGFKVLLQRIIDEKATPTKYRKPEDQDLYDLDE